MTREITHEHQFYEWFEEEFPSFVSPEGRQVLEQRADEIVKTIDKYFTPSFMSRSSHADYFIDDLERVREAHREGDLDKLCEALDVFKASCKWL